VRKIIDEQMKIGEVDISCIEFDLKSRDEIPKLLMGLQAVYCNIEIRTKVFAVLEKTVPKKISKTTGRPGMELWKILVLGTLRLNCNWDYDKVKEMADNHATVREMLGHVKWFDTKKYPLQTLKDNISLFTPEVLDKINKIVVDYGHCLKKKAEELKCRCDSFVVESNVHYPTDTNLLFDAVRKSVFLTADIFRKQKISTWRQSKSLIQKLKNSLRKFQKMKHSNSKDESKKQKRKDEIKAVCRNYTKQAEILLKRVLEDIEKIREKGTDIKLELALADIIKFTDYGERLVDLIIRRVVSEEKIPHEEKFFSIFEEYTEWLSKGKAGVPQELGLKVCIIEDQFGFILNHRIMQNEVDGDITVSFTEETKKLFPKLKSCSYDKGFWKPENRESLNKIIDTVILPKKGKLSQKDKDTEFSDEFRNARRKHSAVESGINALENHGLDRCPDKGIKAFGRYISLAVLARNLQILGDIVQKKEAVKKKRSEKMKQTKKRMAA
jgi:transposase, IS5 family